MGQNYGVSVPTDNLKFYFDVNNPKCVNASAAITSSTTLTNLVDSSYTFAPYDTTSSGLGAMSFTQDNGNYVYSQNAKVGGEPSWVGASIPRVDEFTFICWYKLAYGTATQRSENIYGGGFSGRTSFYLVPGGTSTYNGVLRYSDASSTNSYSAGSSYGATDNNWHCWAAVDYGPDGYHKTDFYIDGAFKITGTSNTSFDTPDGNGTPIWSAWTETYGNFGGSTNLFMYYEKALTAAEIYNVYQNTRTRFGV